MFLKKPLLSTRYKKTVRILYLGLLFLILVISLAMLGIIYSKQVAFDLLWYEQQHTPDNVYTTAAFPVSVYPAEKIITENTEVSTYLREQLSYIDTQTKSNKRKGYLTHLIAKLATLDWYQNLASPEGRILVINPGARKEEIVRDFAKILHWDQQMQETFLALVVSNKPPLAEGKFFPGHYLVDKDATPEEVAQILIDKFNAEIAVRYPEEVQRIVPMNNALTIASLLEREAYDFNDMREISGIIWNRLFIDMPLQIDATLQYANGSQHKATWYPPVVPKDKYIDSPFNTYKHKGLPPLPIGNPSTAAVFAALNPIPTKCIFYFHDAQSTFHCSETYKEHVRLLKKYYGQGK